MGSLNTARAASSEYESVITSYEGDSNEDGVWAVYAFDGISGEPFLVGIYHKLADASFVREHYPVEMREISGAMTVWLKFSTPAYSLMWTTDENAG